MNAGTDFGIHHPNQELDTTQSGLFPAPPSPPATHATPGPQNAVQNLEFSLPCSRIHDPNCVWRCLLLLCKNGVSLNTMFPRPAITHIPVWPVHFPWCISRHRRATSWAAAPVDGAQWFLACPRAHVLKPRGSQPGWQNHTQGLALRADSCVPPPPSVSGSALQHTCMVSTHHT